MRLDLDNVTCENCIHREVCGKKNDMEVMLDEIKKIMAYSKYEDFKVFVECTHGTIDRGFNS